MLGTALGHSRDLHAPRARTLSARRRSYGARMRCTRFAIVSVIAALLAACGGDGRANGVIVTEDGRFVTNSAENTRIEAERAIESDLGRALAPHWTVDTAIAQVPRWDDRAGEGDWQWAKADVAVTLLGDGEHALPISADEIRTAVESFLSPRVDRPKQHLRVTVSEGVRPAPAAPIASATAAAPRPAGGPQTYVVQPGDTLALISSAFYGTPQHWRHIQQANGGVDPAGLQPGMTLTIPPRPE